MTHSELRDLMRTLANVDANRLPDAQATQFLNEAQSEIMSENRLRFGESLITTAFVASTQTINPAPTEGVVLEPTRMWYVGDDGSQQSVSQISWNEYVDSWGNAASVSTGTGDPAQFAVYGEDSNGNPTFYLGPIPDAARTVYLAARIEFNDLDAADDENQLTERAALALVYRALVMAAPFLEDDEMAAGWQGSYESSIRRHVVSHEGARYSGKSARSMVEPG